MNLTNLSKYKQTFMLVLIIFAVIAAVTASLAVFTDLINRTTTIRTASFNEDGYSVSVSTPEGYLTAGETVEITFEESNTKINDISSQITLTVDWDSPVPDSCPWDDIEITWDGNSVTHTVNQDKTISIVLPERVLFANTSSSKSSLVIQLPSQLTSTGSLMFTVEQIELRSGQWTTQCDADILDALHFDLDLAWNISYSQTTMQGNVNRDVIALLSPGTSDENYTLEIIKNGSDSNTNYGQMMNWTAAKQTPWAGYEIAQLYLSEGITTIGCYAFAEESCITALTLPDTTHTIGMAAFQESGLTGELNIPNTVTMIESRAFSSLPNVSTITFEHDADDTLILPDNTSDAETSGVFYVSDYVKTTLNFNGNTVAENYDWVADHRMKVGISEATISYETVEVGATMLPTLVIAPSNYDDYQSIKYKLTSGDEYAEIDPETGALTGIANGSVAVQVTIIDANGDTVQASTDITIVRNPIAIEDAEIGTTVVLDVDGEPTEFIIVHQGKPNSTLYDDSCDGTWLLMKDVYVNQQWAKGTGVDYSASNVHSYLNEEFLPKFDSVIQNLIKEVKILYSSGTIAGNGLETKIFLLSGPELGLSSAGYGTKLDYFMDGTSDEACAHRYATMSGEEDGADYWTRGVVNTATNDSAYYIQNANTDNPGNILGQLPTNSSGVRPALILPGDIIINGDGSVDVSNIYFDIDSEPTQNGTLTYTGEEQTVSWSGYDSTQVTLSGTTSATNAGTYTAIFTPKDHYRWSDGTEDAKEVTWTIEKADGSLSVSPTSLTLDMSDSSDSKMIAVTRAGDGVISATSSDTSVAVVSVSNTTVTVTKKAAGSANITISVAEGTNHTAPANATVPVTINAPLTGISLNKSSTSLEVGATETLSVTYNPADTTDNKTVTWASSDTSVATVSDGKITAVASGTTTVSATVGSHTATCTVAVTVATGTTYEIRSDGYTYVLDKNGTQIDKQLTNSKFTVPATGSYSLEIHGGGGGGAGGCTWEGGYISIQYYYARCISGGGGGGSGKFYDSINLTGGTSYSVTVGAGGSGGSAGSMYGYMSEAGNGYAGTASTFGSYTASGGNGAYGGDITPNGTYWGTTSYGGAAGDASDANNVASSGTSGTSYISTSSVTGAAGGSGGGTYGDTYGSGGQGGSATTSSAKVGSAGADGIIVLKYLGK